jgi:hypothetical protein
MRAQSVALYLGLALFAPSDEGVLAADDEAELAKVRAEIVKMIGNAPCANLVHCRVLALGARPCGGPDEYLAYSHILMEKDRLENMAADYTLIQEELQRAAGRVGVCTVLPAPRLACVDGRCRIDQAP